MPANLENSAVATGLESSVFIPLPEKGNAKQCSIYYTIALISHVNKVMLSSPSQASTVCELRASIYSSCIWKRQKNQRSNCQQPLDHKKGKRVPGKNTYFCFIDWVDHNKLWKLLQEMGIPDHFICLLRNLCAGQEVTVRTGHGKKD